jgi:tetratricopeptide (TPR) repeat protein
MVLLENLERIDWQGLSHAYGPATDVPACLRRLLGDEEQRRAALHELYGSIYHQGDRYSATPAAIPFLFELVLASEVGNRAAILELVTHLVAGDCCFRNGLTLNDGERVLFFGRELVGDDARGEPPRIWRQCYEATLAFLPQLLDLAVGPEPSLRLEAARVLGCLRTRAAEIGPRLAARVATEEFDDVRANLLFALHRLHGPAFDARGVLGSMLPKLSRVCATVAAMGLVRVDAIHSGERALEALKAGLAGARKSPDDERFYAACRFGEGLAGDIGHTIGNLPHELARPFLPLLCRALRGKVELLATLGLTTGTLRAGFSAPHAGGPLGDANRVALAALLENDDVWTVANNRSLFRRYGLPEVRQSLGELAGLSPGDGARGIELIGTGVALARAGKLAEAQADFERALACFPQDSTTWANVAWCARSLGQNERAVEVPQRGSALFPDSTQLWSELIAGLFALGCYPEAEAAATAAILHDPGNAYLPYLRACARVHRGNFDAAVADIARTIELDAKLRAEIAVDEDLVAVRGRADFQRLIGA